MNVGRGNVKVENPKMLKKSGEGHKEFTFDAVYDWNSKQMDLYNETFRPIVESVLEGYNGNCRSELQDLLPFSFRNNICVWTNGNWKNVHYGRNSK
eukprot:m.45101 g.45101  ORF g.45101 m.45101 type:complete len:96 (+) comp33564_c0_seq7:215-502(+)